MLNYETLLSSYDDKLTLLQWLKKIEAALKDASAVSFKVNKKGDATLTFSIVFEDGSELESGEIVLQQGESVQSAAIVNGHLILTLTNGDQLDAGVLFSGNVNIAGNMIVSGNISSDGKISAPNIEQTAPTWAASFNFISASGLEITNIYNRCEVINNVLYLIANIKIKNISGATKKIGAGWGEAGYIGVTFPAELGSKIIDLEGKAISEAATPRAIITSVPVVCCENVVSSNSLITHEGFRFDFTNLSAPNSAALYLENYPMLEMPIDGELYIMGRIALTLI